jgi:hypothetical protein
VIVEFPAAGPRRSTAPQNLKVIDWNKTLDPDGRFDAAMKAEVLFEIASAPASK